MLKNVFICSVLGLALCSPALFATPLPAGTGTNSVSVASGVVGTLLADTGLLPFIGTNSHGATVFTGTVQSLVYLNSDTGGLDFYYQVANDLTSPDAISRITMTSFGSFTTDVSFLAGSGTSIAPFSANRQVSGDTIGFSFQDPVTQSDMLLQGTVSPWLLISTNATSYTFGSTQMIDGGVGTVTTFAPAPEPVSMGLLGGGLVGLGVVRLRRSRKK